MNKHILNYLLAALISLICVFFPLHGLRAESASNLIEQGQKSYDLGQYISAYDLWHKAENIYAKASDQQGVFGSRVNQSQALLNMGQYRNACKIMSKSFGNTDDICDNDGFGKFKYKPLPLPQSLEANGLLVLGESLRLIGNFDVSIDVINSIANSTLPPSCKSTMLASLGNVSRDQGKRERDLQGAINKDAGEKYFEAIEYYQQSIQSAPNNPLTVKSRLNLLSLRLEFIKNLAEDDQDLIDDEEKVKTNILKASFNSQELIERIQDDLRQLPVNSDKILMQIHLAKALINDKKEQWGTIENLLSNSLRESQIINDRRLQSYSLGIMGLVNEKRKKYIEAINYSEQAISVASSIQAEDLVYQWEWQNARNLQEINKSDSDYAIAAYKRAITSLDKIRKETLSINAEAQFSLRDNVEPLYRQFVDLTLKSTNLQKNNLRKVIINIESLQRAEIENFLQCQLLNSEPKEIIDAVNDPNAAVFYPIILDDRLEVILSLPNGETKRFTSSVSKKELELTIKNFVEKIQQTHADTKQYQEEVKLYDWLIRPAKSEITSNIKTLVFVMDGSLRNIPVAALYDSKAQAFLMDQYFLAYTPGTKILGARSKSNRFSSALIAGLKNIKLKYIQKEVNAVKAYLPKSTELTGADFTVENLSRLISSNYYSVIHLATHGSFSSNPKKTYIEATDRNINIDEIQQLLSKQRKIRLNSIELLVLSACETAIGDRRAALGLAGVALRSGSNSTLASLWAVDDESTSQLMDKFYSVLTKNPNMTKAEALVIAQKDIRNKYDQYGYYWAPFVLVGDWL
jgi:CHAT domain-containing protein/tetratricopeptide (TPR) repeat protein